MSKVRAYGADATLKACREASYGMAPLSGYQSLDFKSTDLSSAQPLGEDPLLGRGRNAQDPYRGLITDEGQLDIPFDLRGTGFWLTGLFGDPVTMAVNASGSVALADNPSPGDTITLNGTVWTFVSGTPSADETEIQATIIQTLDQLVSDLNESADAEISKCTYTRPTSTQTLVIVFDAAGPTGNSFTIAASAASVSSPTLTGGGYAHVWESGADDIPSYTIEIGHPKLTTPVFFRHLGTVMESINFEMGQEGPANARLQLVAQGEERFAATVDASPDAFSLRRFSQGRGFIRRGGQLLAGVTGGSLTFSNNLERVRVIREDGKIEAADPTFASAEGSMSVRFDGATLVAEAANGDPVALDYGFTFPDPYKASSGYSRTAIANDASLSVDNLDVEGVFDNEAITEEELRAGLFDQAEVRIFLVNWADPSMGALRMRRGWFGEVVLTEQGVFRTELRGMTQALSQRIGELYSPECRADLGDHRCKVPVHPSVIAREQAYALGQHVRVATGSGAGSQVYEDRIYRCVTAGTTAADQPAYDTSVGQLTTDGTAVFAAMQSWSRAGIVTDVVDRAVFTATLDEPRANDGWFAGGVLTWESGPNAGRSIEVKAWTQAMGEIELFLPMGYAIGIGDLFRIHPGCDKRLDTCIARFANVLNFRGEPYVPGQDAMMSYPDAR